MLQVGDVRTILRIDDSEDITDDEIQSFIMRYARVIMSELGQSFKESETLFNDALFEECLLAIIACQLSRTDIEMIHAPSEYKVGDTTLKYNNTSMGLYGSIPSWCDYYANLLSALSDKSSEIQNVRVFRRHGMACREGWWHI
jgi:hypothetical protein